MLLGLLISSFDWGGVWKANNLYLDIIYIYIHMLMLGMGFFTKHIMLSIRHLGFFGKLICHKKVSQVNQSDYFEKMMFGICSAPFVECFIRFCKMLQVNVTFFQKRR